MGEKSAIAWCDNTFNPWIGCTKVEDSPACHWCYAWWMDVTKFSKTMGGGTKENPISHWGKGAPRYRTSPDAWKNPLKWNSNYNSDPKGSVLDLIPDTEHAGVSIATQRKLRVFSLSLGDWLDEEVPIEWLADFLKVIHDTPNLDWLLLTKRPENWRERVDWARNSMFQQMMEKTMGDPMTMPYTYRERVRDWLSAWLEQGEPPQNVRIGITAEDQPNYEKRLPHFLNIPALSRFISIEPMISGIDLSLEGVPAGKFTPLYNHVHQIIVGGESGHHWKDRVLDLEAAADIYAQCKRWGVKFFMKQDSGPRPGMRGRIPDDLWVQEFPT